MNHHQRIVLKQKKNKEIYLGWREDDRIFIFLRTIPVIQQTNIIHPGFIQAIRLELLLVPDSFVHGMNQTIKTDWAWPSEAWSDCFIHSVSFIVVCLLIFLGFG